MVNQTYHPAFVESAYKEMAQGRYKENASLAFVEIPNYLMAETEWAWNAGWKAAMSQMAWENDKANVQPATQRA